MVNERLFTIGLLGNFASKKPWLLLCNNEMDLNYEFYEKKIWLVA